MAEGRFLSRSIAHSEQLANVPLEADYLFTRCIPHLDRDGRMPGHPDLVKAITCPLRPEITSGLIPDLVRSLSSVGLLRWYQVGDKQILEFPGFRSHQRGLKYEREAESRYPPSDCESGVDLVRTNSGPAPDQVPLKLSEVKGSKSRSRSKVPGPNNGPGALSLSGRETWLTPYVEVWERLMGHGSATTIAKQMAKVLRPLDEHHGAAKVAAHLESYLSQTPAKYNPNPTKFAQTFASWDPDKDQGLDLPLSLRSDPLPPFRDGDPL